MICCFRVNALWLLLLLVSGGLSITKNLFRLLVSPSALSWSRSSSVYSAAQELRNCGYQPAWDVGFILMELYRPMWGCSSRHTQTIFSVFSRKGSRRLTQEIFSVDEALGQTLSLILKFSLKKRIVIHYTTTLSDRSNAHSPVQLLQNLPFS